MVFEIVQTKHTNGQTYHGVTFYPNPDLDKQHSVVISSGDTYAAAFRLYNDLSTALVNAGLAVQTKNKAANDSVDLNQKSQLLAAQRDVIKWRRMAWSFGAISLLTWFNHYILHSPF